MIRALIADDEELARRGLRALLEKETDIDLVGEVVDGPSALAAIERHEPNLLFLDIQMPGFDAFEVLERVPDTLLPAIVFTTAYDRYAVQAFQARALDYLLKPISVDRFRESLERARMQLTKEEELDQARQRVRELMRSARRHDAKGESAGAMPISLQRFVVKDRDNFLLLKADEVDWIESAGNYVELHARGRTFLVRTRMNDLEVQLDVSHFARIHRSTIVNVDRVREIRPSWHGDFTVLLGDGIVLRMSRGYRNRLLSFPGAQRRIEPSG